MNLLIRSGFLLLICTYMVLKYAKIAAAAEQPSDPKHEFSTHANSVSTQLPMSTGAIPSSLANSDSTQLPSSAGESSASLASSASVSSASLSISAGTSLPVSPSLLAIPTTIPVTSHNTESTIVHTTKPGLTTSAKDPTVPEDNPTTHGAASTTEPEKKPDENTSAKGAHSTTANSDTGETEYDYGESAKTDIASTLIPTALKLESSGTEDKKTTAQEGATSQQQNGTNSDSKNEHEFTKRSANSNLSSDATAQTPLPSVNATVESTQTPLSSVNANVESTQTPLPSVNAKVDSTQTSLPSVSAKVESTNTPISSVNAKVESTQPPLFVLDSVLYVTVPSVAGIFVLLCCCMFCTRSGICCK